MLSKFLRVLGLFFLIGVLAGCGGSDESPGNFTPVKAKTTVLAYMVASNLTTNRYYDLIAMQAAQSSPDVNVVIQIGGGDIAGPAQEEGVDMRVTRRYHLVAESTQIGANWRLVPLPESEQPANVAMNKPETLSDFLRWGARTFPANQYVLTMSDHGGGPIAGYGNDEALGGGNALSTNDLQSAIAHSGVRFELIGFDACLMGSLEMASAFAPYGKYFLASEEVTYPWVEGWTASLNLLASSPVASGEAIGRAFIEGYRAGQDVDFTAYSLTDLRQISTVVASLEEVSSTLLKALKTGGLAAWQSIAVARREAQDFQSNIFSTQMDLVDVQSWIHELGKVGLLSADQVSRFDASMKTAVVLRDGNEEDVNGLMMYFPRYSVLKAPLLAKYDAVNFSPMYRELVKSFSLFAQDSTQMPSISLGATTVQAGTGAVTASVHVLNAAPFSPALSTVTGRLYDQAFGVLIQNGVAVAMQAATAQANLVRIDKPNLWPTVDGTWITLLPDDDDDAEIPGYLIPVVRSDNRQAGMLVAFKEKDGRTLIRGFVEYSALAGSTTSMLRIDSGTKFEPLHFDLAQGVIRADKAGPLAKPVGDWEVKMTTVMQPGYSVAMAASRLTGDMTGSAQAVALPVAGN